MSGTGTPVLLDVEDQAESLVLGCEEANEGV